MATFFLCAFLFIIIIQGQETDTSISLSHFMHSKIDGIPMIMDEGRENTFFLDTYYSQMLNDYHINHVIVDGSLHLPYGSYFFPTLLPKGSAPDSIHNFSQIHYRKGDYDSGELGLALQIEGNDSTYFSLQGFRQSPPVMYISSSFNDNLQNYLISYNRLSEDASISVDIMYHLENYHLPLSSGFEYERKAESFHSGLGFEKNWGRFWVDFHPAFQVTYANRQGLPATYFTLWHKFSSKMYLGDHFNLSLQQKSKMMMAEKDSHLSEIEIRIIRPRLQYHSGGIMLEGGVALYSGLFESEGKASWRYKNIYVAAGREFHIYLEPVHMAEFEQNKYSLLSLNIGYISKQLKVILDIFNVMHSSSDQPGVRGEMEMDYSWLRLSQKAGIYNINNDDGTPVNIFNHMSLLFSPNIWLWRTARFQPFMGVESIYLQHSGKIGIDPTAIPVFQDLSPETQPYNSHLVNMELGFLVNRFKVSYLWINLLGESIQNTIRTYPIQPIQQLTIEWQFWN